MKRNEKMGIEASEKERVSERRRRLTEAMERNGVSAMVIPTADENLSEYVAEHWKTRRALSGFTGSAGTLAVVSAAGSKEGEEAWALWTDSRYYLQAEAQLEGTGIELMRDGEEGVPSVWAWLTEKVKAGGKVSLPWALMSVREWMEAKRGLKGVETETGAYEQMVDEAWMERPGRPTGKVVEYDVRYAGESREQKMERARKRLREEGAEALLTAATEEVAWLLNLRGGDEPYTPTFAGTVLLTQTGYTLYTDHEVAEGIEAKRMAAVKEDLRAWSGGKIAMDINKTPAALRAMVKAANVKMAGSVVGAMKAVKNETEIEDTRRTMETDGVALARHWKWMEETKEEMTEMSVAEKLHELRREAGGAMYKSESFETIAAWREHGAIVHYSATEETNSKIEGEGLLLIDSGGQYLMGTTDVTRTYVRGEVDEETRRDFTLVLKGHIGVAMSRFPKGTAGRELDVIAKQHLWAEGKDYGHGTGHGVGHYLCVHEGPQRIGKKGTVAMEAGMVTSNEPGYYKAGRYGIRHENLTLTVADEKEGWLKMETLTLCPFDAKGVETEMLTREEKAWLKAYHEEIIRRLQPRLTKEEAAWLKEKCEPFLFGQE